MNKSFQLDWHELPEELREEKVRAFIEANKEEYAQRYVEEHFPDLEEEEKDNKADSIDVDEIMEDLHFYEDAEYSIEARFPMYF